MILLRMSSIDTFGFLSLKWCQFKPFTTLPSILGLCFSFGEESFGSPLCELHLLLSHVKIQSTNLMLPLVQLWRLPFCRNRLHDKTIVNKKGISLQALIYTIFLRNGAVPLLKDIYNLLFASSYIYIKEIVNKTTRWQDLKGKVKLFVSVEIFCDDVGEV